MSGDDTPGKPHNKPENNRGHGSNTGRPSNNPRGGQKPHRAGDGGSQAQSNTSRNNASWKRDRDDRGQGGADRRDDRHRPDRERPDRGRSDRRDRGPRRDDRNPERKGDGAPQRRNRDDQRPDRRPTDKGPTDKRQASDRDGRRGQSGGPDARGRGRDDRGRPGGPPGKRDGQSTHGPSDRRGPERDRGSRPGQSSESRPPRPVREHEPELPEEASVDELHGEVKRELRSLPKNLAENVGAHLVAAGQLMDVDPAKALEHARFARKRAARVGAVREANGLTAYHNGEWSEALSELRAARRMTGDPGHLPIMADCERALGRAQRALELSRDPEAPQLPRAEAVELSIVIAGARRDLGQIEASVVALQLPELESQEQNPWNARLFYAYADNLLAADRVQEAFTWFVHAADADDEGETDAPDRLDELFVRLGGDDAVDDLVTGSGGGDSWATESEDVGGDEAGTREEAADPGVRHNGDAAATGEARETDGVEDTEGAEETEGTKDAGAAKSTADTRNPADAGDSADESDSQ